MSLVYLVKETLGLFLKIGTTIYLYELFGLRVLVYFQNIM